MEKYKNLKKNLKSVQNQKWNLENLRDGFEYFKELNGTYPTSKEIDYFYYLPTRRMIERNFGGIVNLRKTLQLNGVSDFTKGNARGVTAKMAFIRSQDYEKVFLDFLISKIPEVRVHEHKIIRPGNTAADFFIYTSANSGIMIDVFYAKDMHSLGGIVRIKALKSSEVVCPIYYVLVDNDKINQEQIDNQINNRKISLQNNIKVMTEKYFKSKIIDSIILEPLNI